MQFAQASTAFGHPIGMVTRDGHKVMQFASRCGKLFDDSSSIAKQLIQRVSELTRHVVDVIADDVRRTAKFGTDLTKSRCE